ncbi:hypothetical protein [Rhodococcus jostii]|uniref:Uncharacterized protein n=1 Tax=Rhodococcus jostii TaxID=132919 RepID=A0A1H5MEZ8_RHOJO|nr:hypothetical protein [Rhodococcus jostii]SEE87723.1 hypothetical protein SAMN04490220_8909 [Rhodococcus jostii]
MRNRLADPRRQHVIATVSQLVDGVRSSTGRDPIPVAAVLVASTAAPLTWLVSIDRDDPTAVLHTSTNGTASGADALTELAAWDQRAWTWIADECAMFGGLHLRARHPELVRRY